MIAKWSTDSIILLAWHQFPALKQFFFLKEVLLLFNERTFSFQRFHSVVVFVAFSDNYF